MVKDEINAIVNNPKVNIYSFKISSDVIEEFFILIIDNQYIKNAPILRSLLGALVGSKSVFSYFSY